MLGLEPITVAIAGATPRALVERQMAKLERLSDIGMEIAEAAGRRACALADGDAADAGAIDPSLSFARAARAVRLTIALQSRLADALAALERGEAVARVGEAARRRDRIQRIVEDAAEAEGCDAVEVERLSSEVWERLIDEDESDLLDAPIEQVVARICRDLGLTPDHGSWTSCQPSFSGGAPGKSNDPVAPDLGDGRGPVAFQSDGPPSAHDVLDLRLQREQRENRNEPGTTISERVRQ